MSPAGFLFAVTKTAGPAMRQGLTWHGSLVVFVVDISIVLIALGMFMCIYRLLRGPHLADRSLAVDTLGVQLIGLVLLLSMKFKTLMFVDGILVLSLLGFAGAVAMAQYIARPHLRSKSNQEPEKAGSA